MGPLRILIQFEILKKSQAKVVAIRCSFRRLRPDETLQAARLAVFSFVLVLITSTTTFAAGGDLDTTFGNGLAGANDGLFAVALQADGKVLIGGEFTTVNGTARGHIARLNADGTLDTAFGNGLAGTNAR